VVKQINYPASSIGHQNCKKEEIKNYSTEYSHVVPHHSTDSAINCLTAQIGRDAVGLVVYGRSSKVLDFLGLLTYTPTPFHQDQDQDQDLPSSIKHHPSSIIHHPSSIITIVTITIVTIVTIVTITTYSCSSTQCWIHLPASTHTNPKRKSYTLKNATLGEDSCA
jgi:hypothetical protein